MNKMNWQSEVTPKEWDEWQKFARKLSMSKKQAKSLGPEDYALATPDSLSLGYLLERLKNALVQAWIRVVL